MENKESKKVTFDPEVKVEYIEKIGHRDVIRLNHRLPPKEATQLHTLRWRFLPDKAGPNDQNIHLRKLFTQAMKDAKNK